VSVISAEKALTIYHLEAMPLKKINLSRLRLIHLINKRAGSFHLRVQKSITYGRP
jgi:hypothetical protein